MENLHMRRLSRHTLDTAIRDQDPALFADTTSSSETPTEAAADQNPPANPTSNTTATDTTLPQS